RTLGVWTKPVRGVPDGLWSAIKGIWLPICIAFAQLVGITEIFGPAAGLLVSNQILTANELDWNPINLARRATCPCRLKLDAGNRRYEVDAVRLDSELHHLMRFAQILDRDIEIFKAKGLNGGKNGGSVFLRRSEQEIDVGRETRASMPSDGESPDNQVLNFVRVE